MVRAPQPRQLPGNFHLNLTDVYLVVVNVYTRFFERDFFWKSDTGFLDFCAGVYGVRSGFGFPVVRFMRRGGGEFVRVTD